MKKIFLFSVLLAVGTSSVWAVSTPRTQRISLDGGMVFPTGVNDFSDSAKAGPTGGVQYLYELDEIYGVGLRADYFQFGSKTHMLTNQDTGGQMVADSQNDAATIEVIGRYNLNRNAKLGPFIRGGVGVAYFQQKADGTPAPGSTWADTNTTESRQVQDDSSVGIAFSLGLGIERKLGETMVLGLEAAWHVFGVKKTTYGTSTITAPNISLALGWRFGPSNSPTNY